MINGCGGGRRKNQGWSCVSDSGDLLRSSQEEEEVFRGVDNEYVGGMD